jgi:hypothetical protein
MTHTGVAAVTNINGTGHVCVCSWPSGSVTSAVCHIQLSRFGPLLVCEYASHAVCTGRESAYLAST